MKLIDEIVGFAPEIRAIRRDIHAHPELGYAEHRTADLVASLLEQWGIEVSRGIGGTGVVGTLKRGSALRSVGLRADLDALPIQEANEFAHRSSEDGRMHACGHDGHTAMLLAAAKALSQRTDFDGTVHFIFQPAEEGGAGGKAMIDDGLFDRFPCDAVFGMHNWPGLELGRFSVRAGPMLASASEFEIRITGRGAHAAIPNESVDPVLIACQLVQALQGILTRNKRPIDTAVLSVTQVHAGDAFNVIPNIAVVRGTVRTFTTEVLDLIETRMREITEQLPRAFQASGRLDFQRNYPPLVNHEAETEFCRRVAASIVGEEQVLELEPVMGSEDFAYMLLERPGCYIAIGNGADGAHRDGGHGAGPCALHNPSYDFNDEVTPLGATYWVRLAEEFLAGKTP
ncbi:MAG: amidohydrolase [Burkholderiaceae bacterium]|nr:amidohydrolase [Burkholderiaceae bacterium]